MELSIKTTTLFILTLLSTSLAFTGFQAWRSTTKEAMKDATSYYEEQHVNVHPDIRQVTFPKLYVKNHTIHVSEQFDARSIASAHDELDGDISTQIEVYGSVNTQHVGTYELRYVVRNSYGLKAVRNIEVTVS